MDALPGISIASPSNPIVLFVFFALLSLAPFAVVGVSSFVKLHVVFSLLRNALGSGQIPSTGVTTVLALVLSAHIMAPVFHSSLNRAESAYAEHLAKKGDAGPTSIKGAGSNGAAKESGIEAVLATIAAGAEPLQEFLRNHSHARERQFFARSRESSEQSNLPDSEDLFSLIPAFLISELQEAFTIGFLIFLPFLVVDLVVANILIGLGMSMMSPVTISLPIKLLLFVLCDGWFLLSKGLVQGYLHGG